MGAEAIELERLGTGQFLARIGAGDDTCELVLPLADGEDASGGALMDDEATARVTTRFFLEHQSAGDLPE